GGDTDVDGMGFDAPAGMLGHDRPGRILQHAAAPAANYAVCAELDEPFCHDPAKPCATPCHQEALAIEKIGPEHGSIPSLHSLCRLTVHLDSDKDCCARGPEC